MPMSEEIYKSIKDTVESLRSYELEDYKSFKYLYTLSTLYENIIAYLLLGGKEDIVDIMREVTSAKRENLITIVTEYPGEERMMSNALRDE